MGHEPRKKLCFRNHHVCSRSQACVALWAAQVQYLSIRIGLFFALVTFLGFLTPWLFGVEDVRFASNVILNHLTVGTLSTFVLAGGWAVLQALWSLNLCGLHHSWNFDGKDGFFIILIIVAIIGAIYLLYQLCAGLYEIAQAGRQVASANLYFRNKEMRQRVVERYPVMNYDSDPSSTTVDALGDSGPKPVSSKFE
ncbi:unnamed protein product [Effrenium voratum]|nr:unnamed protein product [Effrenium voratum]